MTLKIKPFFFIPLVTLMFIKSSSFAQEDENKKVKLQDLRALLKEKSDNLTNKSLNEIQQNFPTAASFMGAGTALSSVGAFYITKKQINSKVNITQLLKKSRAKNPSPSRNSKRSRKNQREKIK